MEGVLAVFRTGIMELTTVRQQDEQLGIVCVSKQMWSASTPAVGRCPPVAKLSAVNVPTPP